jgi:CRISPR/Cas system CSM-associated protein Csm2 small subunit
MGRNKENRKKLEGQYKALEEHLDKIAQEKLKPIEIRLFVTLYAKSTDKMPR